MAIGDAAMVHRSRRAILFGGLGALGVLAAKALPGSTEAVDAGGSTIQTGGSYDTHQATTIYNRDASDYFRSSIDLAGPDSGAYGASATPDGEGLTGLASGVNGIGVHGTLLGSNGSTAVWADTSGKAHQVGVLAEAIPEGYAVWAKTHNGAAVRASATGGYALQAEGVTVFDRAGSISFAKGQLSKTVSMFMNHGDTLVVATIQGDVAGTWVRGVVVDVPHQHFVVKLNRAAPKALRVGYFVIN
jgi:hypothetical protein